MSFYSDTVLADSPLAYWPLNTAAGDETDLGSGGHTLTYVGTPTRAQPGLLVSDSDTCVRFDADSDYCSTPTTSDLTFLTAFSAECWVKFDSIPGGLGIIFVAKGAGGGGGWAFYNRLGFVTLTLYGVADIISAFVPVINTIYHLVVVWRASGNTDFYVNYSKQNVATAGSPITNVQPTVVGQLSDFSGSTPLGYVDEVALYGTALSDAQVLAHYKAGAFVERFDYSQFPKTKLRPAVPVRY